MEVSMVFIILSLIIGFGVGAIFVLYLNIREIDKNLDRLNRELFIKSQKLENLKLKQKERLSLVQ